VDNILVSTVRMYLLNTNNIQFLISWITDSKRNGYSFSLLDQPHGSLYSLVKSFLSGLLMLFSSWKTEIAESPIHSPSKELVVSFPLKPTKTAMDGCMGDMICF
jgi:hypothetical protein